MKKNILLILLAINSLNAFAQLEEVFAARDDAAIYTKQYLNPAMNGIMSNLNNGWYSSGKTHKKFGFDISLFATTAIIPDEDKVFQFIASDYNYLSISSGSSTLPTIAGGTTTTILEAANGGDSVTFNAVDGLAEDWPTNFFIPVSIPTPMIQVGFGFPKNTDVKLRFYPTTHKDDVSYGLIGVGIQHNLTQYFKILEKIPTLHISGLGAFTKANIAYTPSNSNVSGSNQSIEMQINSYTLQVIGDIDIKILNFYLGMGYTSGNTSLDALGNYEFDFDDNGTIENDEIITDPIQLDFAITGFKTTIGTRLNLGPVKIFGDYTLQKYPSLTLGIAVGIR